MQYAVVAALTGDRSHQVDIPTGARRARAHHNRSAQRDSRNALRGAARRVLRDADAVAAAWTNGRRLRAGAAARNRHPLRVRLGLRHAAGGRLLSASSSSPTRPSSSRSTPTSPHSRAGICSRRERFAGFSTPRSFATRSSRLAVTFVIAWAHLGSPRRAAAHLHQRADRHRSVAACQRARTKALPSTACAAVGRDSRHLPLHHCGAGCDRRDGDSRRGQAGARPRNGSSSVAASGAAVVDRSRHPDARDQRTRSGPADRAQCRAGHD